MFEYSRGYEIDGSDTSYTIVTPALQNCRDILEYYLRLKVVHKDAPIVVKTAGGPDRRKLQGREYSRARLPELCDELFRLDITRAELVYLLVSPNNLYPEVKRDLLDEIIRLSGKNPVFTAPEFRGCYDVHESIIISLSPAEAERAYCYTSCACGDDYVKDVLQTPYFTMEFIISRGSPQMVHFYSIKKLSEAFPELKIDCTEVFHCVIYDAIDESEWLERYILERIEISSPDYRETLRRIADLDAIQFFGRYERTEGDLDLANAYNLDTSTGVFDYEYIHISDDSRSYKPEPDARILAGIFGKSTGLSISGYVDGVMKLSGSQYFTDASFMYYTTVWCRVEINSKLYYGYIRFERRKGGPILVMCVPWKIREPALRLLKNI